MNDTSRYIVAIVLAMVILFSWQILFPVEEPLTEMSNHFWGSYSLRKLSQTNIISNSKSRCLRDRYIIRKMTDWKVP